MPSSLPLPFLFALLTILFLPHVTPTTPTTPTIHQVSVGQNGIFYVPDSTTAKVGDKVVFDFYNNHSVVEGSWTTPCVPLSNGFYSGFIAAPLDSPAAPQHFVVTINDTQPHYYYCAQEGLCNAGMVGVINAPSNQPGDLAAFAVRAAETDPNASAESLAPPNAPIGGVISIESASAVASASNDDSYSYLLTAFASGPVAAPTNATNGSYVPTGIISDTTRQSSATMSLSGAPSTSAGSSGSSVGKVTSVVMVTPASSLVAASSTSVISSSPAPSATTKKGAAGRVGVGDMGLVMLPLVVLVGIMLSVG